MTYRTLKVNGESYEYVIGSKFTKIKQHSVVENSLIGNQLLGTNTFVVTPKTVRDHILGKQLPRVFVCKEHNITTTELVYNPYELEIYNTKSVMPNCSCCVDERAGDI